jgi:sporulation protein YlmC with PRC-barrel domain
MDETAPDDLTFHRLISSRTVEGTPVFNQDGERFGKVHSVMIDKFTGQVAYAILDFGSIVQVGENVHPIPWEKLTYDPDQQGYVLDISPDVLAKAPFLTLDQADRPRPVTAEEKLYAYYGVVGLT